MANTPFPKLLAPELVCSEMERLYGFSSRGIPRLIDGGVESAAWHFRTDRGDWIVKVYAPCEGQLKRATEETALYEYLSRRGIHTPKVLLSKRAQPVEELHTKTYAYPVMAMKCEDLRFAHPVSIRKAELVCIGQTVARMHQCLKNYPHHQNPLITGEPPGVVLSLKLIARKAVRTLRSFGGHSPRANPMTRDIPVGYDIFIISPYADAFTPEERTHFRVLHHQMKAYLSAHPASRLTASIIHGDLALHHTPLLPNGEVYLFDFADYSYATIPEELGAMLAHLYIDDDITFDRWEELKDWLLAAYVAASPLTPEDISAISPSIMRKLLVGITYRCDISREVQRETRGEDIRRRYQLAEYLLQTAT